MSEIKSENIIAALLKTSEKTKFEEENCKCKKTTVSTQSDVNLKDLIFRIQLQGKFS